MARFITLEGVDGSGKSTHLAYLRQQLEARSIPHVITREPGGTALGEQLRTLLLTQPMHAETETLLMFAARREHLDKVIVPNLREGRWVVCDRFSDASFAYQGGGRGVDLTKLQQLESWVQGKVQPELTLLFDLPTAVAEQRRGERTADRFEQESSAFFDAVRNAYLARAQAHPTRFRVIDASRPLPLVQKDILLAVFGRQ